MSQAISLLCIDDEPLFLDVFKTRLEQEPDLAVTTAATATDALDLLNRQYFDAIIADYSMPDMDGLSLLREVRSRGGQSVFVVATAKRLAHIARDALNTGADYYLQKGADMADEVPRLIDFLRTRIPQKNAEFELVSWARFYNSVVDNSAELICRIRPGGEITFVNEPFVHLFKKPYRQLVQENFFNYVPAAEREEILGCLRALSPELPDCLLLHHVLAGEGQVATLEWSYHAFFSAEGEPQEYQLGGRDVSSLRKIGAGEKIPAAYIPATESVVKNAELSELVATLQSLEAPVFAVDENGVILAWSKKLVELTGIAAADMVGKGGQEYGVPFYGKCAPMLVDNVLPSSSGTKNEGRPVAKREGETLIGEMEQVTIKGKTVFMGSKCSPVYDNADRLLAVVEVIMIGEPRTDQNAAETYLGGFASPTLKAAGDDTGHTLAGTIGSAGADYGLYATTRRVFVLRSPTHDANALKDPRFGTVLMDKLFGTAEDTREKTIGELENSCMFAAAKEEIASIVLKWPTLISGYLLIQKKDRASFRFYLDNKKTFARIDELMKKFAPDLIRYE